MNPNNTTFAERQAASAAAKKALLEKFKPKPMIQAEEPIDHEKERRERIEAIRAQREQEKEEKRRAKVEATERAKQQKIEAERAAEAALLEAQQKTDAQKRAERKDRKKAMKEAARLKKMSRQGSGGASRGPVAATSSNEDPAAEARREHERYIRQLERQRA